MVDIKKYGIEIASKYLKAQEFGSVKVSFRIPFGQNIQAIIQEFIDEFETEYPSVDIELDVVSGYDEMKEATIQDINGGKVPTMTVGYPDHFAEYLITKSIIALDNFIEDEKVGYTQDELGRKLNVTNKAVSKWENDSGLPDISQVVPLATVFNETKK